MRSDFEDNESLYSMTGYGEGSASLEDGTIEATVRSLNHDGTSVKVRGLRRDQSLVHETEKFIRNSFPRGRIEVEVRSGHGDGLSPSELDREAISRSYVSLSGLAEELGMAEGPRLGDLIDLDLLATEPLYKGRWDTVKEALEEAVADTLEAQKVEGESIGRDLEDELDEIADRLSNAEKRIPEVVRDYKRDLRDRVGDLLEGEVELDPGRLEQEVATFADKVDVNEEISRAKTHVEAAREALDKGGVVGKRLEFLRQELQREINTLGAKAKDDVVQSEVIEMKLALEKFKEQSRNLA